MYWISVEERLPETRSCVHGPDWRVSGLVLVYDEKEGILVGWLEEDGDYFDWVAHQILDNYLLRNVTHWMPLPEDPK